VHVVPAIEYRVGRLAPTLPITRTLDDPYASSVLHDARRIAWNRGVAARTVLIAGETPRAIVALATRLHADLLAIAEEPGHKLWPIPSRTRRWLKTHAPCPVLAVPADRPPPGATEPLPQPASAENALALCCVCDGGRCACCAERSGLPF
jgi:nucleotide-binding universal stress UspA family protein